MEMTYVVLYVAEIAGAVNFYREAFGLEHRFTHSGGDYAEMETGTTTLAFCGHALAENLLGGPYRRASRDAPPLGAQITLSPADVASAFTRAVAAGAKPLAPPERKPWGFEVAYVQDPDGHLVELARRVEPR